MQCSMETVEEVSFSSPSFLHLDSSLLNLHFLLFNFLTFSPTVSHHSSK
jgi:hypothetical protein